MSRLLVVLFVAVALAAPSASSAEDDDFVIVGEILKPEITVVISRENLNKAYELKLEESFLDKIIQSVEAPPF